MSYQERRKFLKTAQKLTLNTAGESGKQRIAFINIQKGIRTKRIIGLPLFCVQLQEKFWLQVSYLRIPIQLYVYQNVWYAGPPLPQGHKPTHGPPPASSRKIERRNWGTRWCFFLSFAFTVYNSLFNSQCYICCSHGKNEHLLSYLQNRKNSVHVIDSDI
jgi:hypothetical protein